MTTLQENGPLAQFRIKTPPCNNLILAVKPVCNYPNKLHTECDGRGQSSFFFYFVDRPSIPVFVR